MPQISINIPSEDDMLSFEISLDMTVGNLKELVNIEKGFEIARQTITLNGSALSNNEATLKDSGVKDGDMLEATQTRPQQQGQPQQQQQTSRAGSNDIEEQAIERLRQGMLQDSNLRSQLSTLVPEAAGTLNDPVRFREHARRLFQIMAQQRGARGPQGEALRDGMDEDSQRRIAEAIRMEEIDRQLAEAQEENPEFFGSVTMLYVNIEINGHPVKAFVDSGAQTTIMSPSLAERCGVTRYIDPRFGGVARGVGTAKILGRVHKATVRIGDAELPCSFTVMEGKGVEMLFGLDMLKRYQATIDLNQNKLVLGYGVSVPFLSESEIPKMDMEEEPTVPGPEGTSVGQNTGAVHGAGESSKKPAAASGGFQGQGRTLGAQSSATSGSQQAAPPAQQSQPGQRPAAPTPATASGSFPEADVETLVRIGATRDQAIEALRACGGNVEYAANLIFQELGGF